MVCQGHPAVQGRQKADTIMSPGRDTIHGHRKSRPMMCQGRSTSLHCRIGGQRQNVHL